MAVYECRSLGLYSYLTKNGYIPFEMKSDIDGVIWRYESTPGLLMTVKDFYRF